MYQVGERNVIFARLAVREGNMVMVFTLLISVFFGVTAAIALVVNGTMTLNGVRAARVIRAELASMDRVSARSSAPSPQGRLVFS